MPPPGNHLCFQRHSRIWRLSTFVINEIPVFPASFLQRPFVFNDFRGSFVQFRKTLSCHGPPLNCGPATGCLTLCPPARLLARGLLGFARSAGRLKKTARYPTGRTPKGLAPKSQELHGPSSVIVTDFIFAMFNEVICRLILGPLVFSGVGCGGQRHFTTWLAGGRDLLRGLN
jgi:hypothetical protein